MESQPNSASNNANRQLSPQRKALYHAGLGLSLVGFLLFISVFVTGALNFGRGPELGNHAAFEQHFKGFGAQGRSMALRGIGGMAMMTAGAALAGVGRLGAAGSGLVPDPQKARSDVEPWARMSGGVLRDSLDEAGINLSGKLPDQELPLDEKLRRMHQLYKDGILSEAEYQREKQELLNNN